MKAKKVQYSPDGNHVDVMVKVHDERSKKTDLVPFGKEFSDQLWARIQEGYSVLKSKGANSKPPRNLMPTFIWVADEAPEIKKRKTRKKPVDQEAVENTEPKSDES